MSENTTNQAAVVAGERARGWGTAAGDVSLVPVSMSLVCNSASGDPTPLSL